MFKHTLIADKKPERGRVAIKEINDLLARNPGVTGNEKAQEGSAIPCSRSCPTDVKGSIPSRNLPWTCAGRGTMRRGPVRPDQADGTAELPLHADKLIGGFPRLKRA